MLDEGARTLNDRRDELTDDLKSSYKNNEDLTVQTRAQDELQRKSIQTKLNRDKPEQIKELLAQEEMVTSMNEETALKLSEEKEKFDTMKSSRLELEATLKLRRDLLKEDEVVNKDQDVLI
jgi:hypothetical protein